MSGKFVSSVRRAFRRNFQLPLSEFFVQVPRLVARATYFALPLYLAYGSKPAIVNGQLTHVSAYPYRWPLIVLLLAYAVAGIYKATSRSSAALTQ